MRCYICDKSMSEAEIQNLPGTLKTDCCATCMEIVIETAYSDGFVKEEPLEDKEIEDEFGDGVVEVLENPDFLFGDSADIFVPNYGDDDYE